MNLYFKNIRVVNPATNTDEAVNLWIKDGVIAHASKAEASIDQSTSTIDASSYVCAPGLFDMHVHFREPGDEGSETLETGANSAANGGFTGVVCMPNTLPAIDDVTVVEYIKTKSKDFMIDLHVSAAITKKREGEFITPMIELSDAGALMFTDDGRAVMSSEVMRRAFDFSSSRDLLISQHCEDHGLTKDFAMNECVLSYKLGLRGYPDVAEEIIASRDVKLAEYLGNRRYHVSHVSTAGAINIVREAKKKGMRVSCEVTPHHFSLCHDVLVEYNTNHKMNPPLRSQDDVNSIKEALRDGTIDCIASDHAPHELHEKDVEFEKAPYGIVGMETSLGLALTNLMHTGVLTLNQIIEKMSVNPRKILNLPAVEIKEGVAANLTIFDPNEEWTVDKKLFRSKSKNTPFDGFKLKGKPKYAINKGLCVECKL